MTLYEETLKLIKDSDMSAPDLARATGLGTRWMYNLYQGKYEDPGVSKIETIHKYLKRKK